MKISVIIPLYKAVAFADAMVSTLVAQTADDYEVICIDDCSPDDTSAVIRAAVDARGAADRFRFLRTERNGGPGAARNVGLRAARGEYIAFMDADDAMMPDMLAAMTAAADAVQADICYCAVRYRGGRDDGRVVHNPPVTAGLFTDDDRRRFLTRFRTFVVAFIYRRDFLLSRGITFPAERSSEDTHFLTRVLLAAHRIAAVDRPLYEYRIQSQSLTTARDETRWRSKLAALDSLMAAAREEGLYEPFRDELDYIYMKKAYIVGALNYLLAARRPSVAILREMDARRGEVVPRWQDNPYLRGDRTLRLLAHILHGYPRLAAHILPPLLRLLRPPL